MLHAALVSYVLPDVTQPRGTAPTHCKQALVRKRSSMLTSSGTPHSVHVPRVLLCRHRHSQECLQIISRVRVIHCAYVQIQHLAHSVLTHLSCIGMAPLDTYVGQHTIATRSEEGSTRPAAQHEFGASSKP